MRITKAMIDAAERKGACLEALEWLREWPKTVRELWNEDHTWADWASAEITATEDQIAYFEAQNKDAEISALERGLRRAFPPRKRKVKR
jgi:hypothetical protein